MAKRLSREEIERRLLELRRSPQPDPEDFRPGAMCYSPAGPPDHWVYVCPTCGRRTAYGRGEGRESEQGAWDSERRIAWDTSSSLENLDAALTVARRLSRRALFALEESVLCAFCRPDADNWVPELRIQLPGEPPRDIGLNLDDLQLLWAFLKGKDRYKDFRDAEHPLKAEFSRLRRLLLGEERSSAEDDGK
jgi:hypothetical protein